MDDHVPSAERALGPGRRERWLRRGVIVGGSLAFTGGAFTLALVLGAFSFEARRAASHRRRLDRMLQQTPLLEQVTAGLADDGSPLIAAPQDGGALEQAVRRWGSDRAEEIRSKARRWPITRVFQAGDMVYFIFFDASQRMRDFTYVNT